MQSSNKWKDYTRERCHSEKLKECELTDCLTNFGREKRYENDWSKWQEGQCKMLKNQCLQKECMEQRGKPFIGSQQPKTTVQPSNQWKDYTLERCHSEKLKECELTDCLMNFGREKRYENDWSKWQEGQCKMLKNQCMQKECMEQRGKPFTGSRNLSVTDPWHEFTEEECWGLPDDNDRLPCAESAKRRKSRPGSSAPPADREDYWREFNQNDCPKFMSEEYRSRCREKTKRWTPKMSNAHLQQKHRFKPYQRDS